MNFYIFTILSFLLFSNVSSESQVILPLIELDDSNWQQILTGEWMVKFFAPWCGACRSAEAEYNRLAENSRKLGIRVAEVDITQQSGLAGRFLINSLPTFYHVKDGVFTRYNGDRTLDAYSNYIQRKTHETVDSVHWLRHPNSIQMSALSLLFKSSEVMKSIHTTLTVDYGLPDWASYVAFIAATVIMGLLLGMVLVACMDMFTSPMPLRSPVPCIQGEHKQIKDDGDQISDEEEEEEEVEKEQSEEGKETIDEVEKDEDVVDEDKSQEGSESSAQTGKSWEKIPTEGEEDEEKLKVQINKEEEDASDEVGDSKVRKSLRKRKNAAKKENKE